MFPPGSRIPGASSVTTGFLLGVSPRLTVPQCLDMLHNLLNALNSDWDTFKRWLAVWDASIVVNDHQSQTELPSEIFAACVRFLLYRIQ